MLTILTAEQRAQLEQMKQQHEQRRAERRSRFGGNGQTN
jgi:Spy/CpxP family protein refolding chaperone